MLWATHGIPSSIIIIELIIRQNSKRYYEVGNKIAVAAISPGKRSSGVGMVIALAILSYPSPICLLEVPASLMYNQRHYKIALIALFCLHSLK
jgi:hypothetical protein